MGDLRNKMAKLARDEAHRRYMAKHFPKARGGPPPPAACWCGLNSNQVEIIARQDRNDLVAYFCRAHFPVECSCWEIATRIESAIPYCVR